MSQNIQCGNWSFLCEKLLTQLRNLAYSDLTLRNYRSLLKRIGHFMETHNYTDYSEQVGKHFYSEWIEKTKPVLESTYFIRMVISRLNDTIRGKEYICHHSSVDKKWPDCFSEQADQYINYLRQRGNRESSVRIRKDYCFEFLAFLVASGVCILSNIDVAHIYDGFSQSNAKSHFSATVKSFLKFIYEYGYHNNDLSVFVPKMRRAQPMPTVFSEQEIQQLFSAIDTSTIIGKRDYAILAFAALLGLRRSDIGNLTLSNIDFRGKMIRISQHKTGIPMELEMLSDVEEALLSYLQVRKPVAQNERIFISVRAPYHPLFYNSICLIAQKRFFDAGIDIKGKKHGTHALRMSLSTQLMSEDVPYSVIQKILGQTDPNSTKHYARIDIDKLRSYALEVPPPSGKFAKHLDM